MQPVEIKAVTLADAWFQALYQLLTVGRRFMIDRGSYAGQDRIEFDYITIHVTQPTVNPRIPEMPEGCTIPAPVTMEYVISYLPYIMAGGIAPGEQYTYGSRIRQHPIDVNLVSHMAAKRMGLELKIDHMIETELLDSSLAEETTTYFLDQVALAIATYWKYGHRNNQMILQVARPEDMLLKDPPCLRHIDTRIQDGELQFFPYFRSWDLWGGFPANLAAIAILQEYMANELGVRPGDMVAASKGLHIYGYAEELARIRTGIYE